MVKGRGKAARVAASSAPRGSGNTPEESGSARGIPGAADPGKARDEENGGNAGAAQTGAQRPSPTMSYPRPSEESLGRERELREERERERLQEERLERERRPRVEARIREDVAKSGERAQKMRAGMEREKERLSKLPKPPTVLESRPTEDPNVTVQRRANADGSPGRWAVSLSTGKVLDADGNWRHEPLDRTGAGDVGVEQAAFDSEGEARAAWDSLRVARQKKSAAESSARLGKPSMSNGNPRRGS